MPDRAVLRQMRILVNVQIINRNIILVAPFKLEAIALMWH
jgi:hypothetical protein